MPWTTSIEEMSRLAVAYYRMRLIKYPNHPSEPFANWVQSRPFDYPDLLYTGHDILDVGAGPMTTLGNQGVSIRAVDIFADEYNILLDELGWSPPVRTERCTAEALDDLFCPASMDFIHCKNGLDHYLNPKQALEKMVTVLKPNGVFYLEAYEYEGRSCGYREMHQWDIWTTGVSPDSLMNGGEVWIQGKTTDVESIVDLSRGQLRVQSIQRQGRNSSIVLRKLDLEIDE